MNEGLKSLTFALFLSGVTLIGYSAGLISSPSDASLPKVIKSAVLPIETAEPADAGGAVRTNYAGINVNPQPNADQPRGIAGATVETSDYAFNDGSGQGAQSVIGAGKIINVIDLKKEDKRFVTIDNPVTETVEGASLPDDYENPLGGPEIDVPDGGTFGVIENGEKITLSENATEQAAPAAKVKKIKPTEIDRYAPRSPLTAAPIASYQTKTKSGLTIPFSPPNKPALYRAYAGKSKLSNRNQSAAFILGGLGMNEAVDHRAIKTLPPEITLGFIPYAPDLQKKINLARQYGHEVILELPAEAFDSPRPDTGPDVLLTSQKPEEIRENLNRLLSKASGYSGVMNYLGGKFFTDEKSVRTLTAALKEYGLYLLENPALSVSVGEKIATDTGIPYIKSQMIADELPSAEKITQNYKSLFDNKDPASPIIVTGYARPDTIDALITALTMAEEGKITRVPVSDLLK